MNGKFLIDVSFDKKLPLTTLETERTTLFPFIGLTGVIGSSAFGCSLNLFPTLPS